MAEKKNFCCVEDFPVLVPYRDLVKLVEVANNYCFVHCLGGYFPQTALSGKEFLYG